MKRCILLAVVIGFLVGINICFYKSNIRLVEANHELYEYFKENSLVDVSGEINLSEVNSIHNNLVNEIKALFNQDNILIEDYLTKLDNIKNSNINLKNEMEKKSVEISNLENEKAELSNQYNVLNNKYNNLKLTLAVSNTIGSGSFPLINQYPNYPTGCESVALTMLLRYYGVNVTPDNIISYLKKESLPYNEGGVRYGGNPELGFVGNPYSKSSYGVYEKPIAEVANRYKAGIQVRNNFSFNEVLSLVQSGHPVMVWTSMGLSVPYISDKWVYKPTMENIYWKASEHAVVVVGYYDNTVVIADPIGGKFKNYSKSLFENRYNYYGRKALFYL